MISSSASLMILDATFYQKQSRVSYYVARDLRCEERVGPPREEMSASTMQMIAWEEALVARGLLYGKTWPEIIHALDFARKRLVSLW